ncbi:MAG: F0F1 ATP synthase subunit A [Candidatus Paceibacterota bacterium]|jgi:F-type H+-transporting ATPase subunit a
MPEISLKAEELFHIGSLPITNTYLVSFLALFGLVVVGMILNEKIKLSVGWLQNIVEVVLEALLELMESVLGSREAAEKYLPLIATIFLFVITSNWLGLLPGMGSILFHTEEGIVPLLRSPASDLNFTLAIAISSVVAANLLGMIKLGFFGHLGKFFNFSDPINFFVGILELVSEFAKVVSFSFRLFGNVFAGEVLLTIVAFLVGYIVPLPFMFLEIFVGFIQAFVFAMLTLVFLGLHTTSHDAHAEAGAHSQGSTLSTQKVEP